MKEPSHTAPGRTLVFVVAYDAARHIEWVFEHVPEEMFQRDDVDFLCVDDASSDDGPWRLARWAEARGVKNLTVSQPGQSGLWGQPEARLPDCD